MGESLGLFYLLMSLALIASIFTFVDFAKSPSYVKDIIAYTVLLLYSLVLAYRPVTIGTDTSNYILAYEYASGLINFDVSNNYELGFNLLMSLCKSLGLSVELFFLIVIFCSGAIIYNSFKLVSDAPLFLIGSILASPIFFLLSTNAFRELPAFALLFLSLSLFISGYRMGSLIAALAAMSMHVSVIYFLIIGFIYIFIMKKSIKYGYFFLIVCLFTLLILINSEKLLISISQFVPNFLFPDSPNKVARRLATYIVSEGTSRIGPATLLHSIIFLIGIISIRFKYGKFVPIRRHEMHNVCRKSRFIYDKWLCSVFIGLAFFYIISYIILSNLAIIARITNHGVIFVFVLLPIILNSFRASDRFLLASFFLIIFVAYFIAREVLIL